MCPRSAKVNAIRGCDNGWRVTGAASRPGYRPECSPRHRGDHLAPSFALDPDPLLERRSRSPGRRHDLWRVPRQLEDGKCVPCRARAWMKPVVESEQAVLHLLPKMERYVRGQQFEQLHIVRGHHHDVVAAIELREHGLRRGDALYRVRAAKQLVDEDETLPPVGGAEQCAHRVHLRAIIARSLDETVRPPDRRAHHEPRRAPVRAEHRVDGCREHRIHPERAHECRFPRHVRSREQQVLPIEAQCIGHRPVEHGMRDRDEVQRSAACCHEHRPAPLFIFGTNDGDGRHHIELAERLVHAADRGASRPNGFHAPRERADVREEQVAVGLTLAPAAASRPR